MLPNPCAPASCFYVGWLVTATEVVLDLEEMNLSLSLREGRLWGGIHQALGLCCCSEFTTLPGKVQELLQNKAFVALVPGAVLNRHSLVNKP